MHVASIMIFIKRDPGSLNTEKDPEIDFVKKTNEHFKPEVLDREKITAFKFFSLKLLLRN